MKKKILVLSSTFPRWENDHEPPFVYELSRRFTDHYEVYVLAPHTAGSKTNEKIGHLNIHRFRYAPEYFEKLSYNGGISTNLKNHPLRYFLVIPFILAELLYTIYIIRKENINLIHAHWIIPQGLVAIISVIFSRKKPEILITAHGTDVFTLKNPLVLFIKRFILNHCNFLTVVSHEVAQELQRLNIKCEIDIIPMGTDLMETFIPEPSKKNRFQLVTAGRLVEKKGIRYLIDGFYKLLDKYPELHLVILGQGPDMGMLQDQVKTLSIEEKVSFTGGLPQSELPAYFQHSSIAVFPFGGQEGFGLVLVEAMGCGCATISTDLPAVKDIIKHRRTGLLIEGNSAEAIFDAVVELLDDDSFRDMLSENARNYVVKHFDWRVISESYINLINRLLEEKMLP